MPGDTSRASGMYVVGSSPAPCSPSGAIVTAAPSRSRTGSGRSPIRILGPCRSIRIADRTTHFAGRVAHHPNTLLMEPVVPVRHIDSGATSIPARTRSSMTFGLALAGPIVAMTFVLIIGPCGLHGSWGGAADTCKTTLARGRVRTVPAPRQPRHGTETCSCMPSPTSRPPTRPAASRTSWRGNPPSRSTARLPDSTAIPTDSAWFSFPRRSGPSCSIRWP